MNNNTEIIDLKKEQISSLERLHYKYSLMARAFFLLMDIVTGCQITLSKAKLIEILASIPYRAWEVRHYSRLTRVYRNYEKVTRSQRIVTWSRSAQDNEYWHLLVIHEKMKTDGIRDAWYLFPLVPYVMVQYIAFLPKLWLSAISGALISSMLNSRIMPNMSMPNSLPITRNGKLSRSKATWSMNTENLAPGQMSSDESDSTNVITAITVFYFAVNRKQLSVIMECPKI